MQPLTDLVYAGDTAVVTVIPDEGYLLDETSLVAVYTDNDGQTRSVALSKVAGSTDRYSFLMPACPVAVSAQLQGGKTYYLKAQSQGGDGTLSLCFDPDGWYHIRYAEGEHGTVGGPSIAAADSYIEIIWEDPDEGYRLKGLIVTGENGQSVEAGEYFFAMPAFPVVVTPVFEQLFHITVTTDEHVGESDLNAGGYMYSYDDAWAMSGETVKITPDCWDPDYAVASVTVAKGDGTPVACEPYSEYYEHFDYTETGWRFVMPDGPVTVTITEMDITSFGEALFTLPAAIQSIGESAFEGDPCVTVVDAGNCTSIGESAFMSSGLVKLRLPQNCAIDNTAFLGCGWVYVYAPAGGMTESSCMNIANCVFVDENA